MTRVLHISSERTWRGGEQQIAYLIRGTNEVKHYVFCRRGSAFESYCRQENIPFEAASFSAPALVPAALRLRQYCREFSIDLVHCHTGKAHVLAWASLTLGLGLPVVVSRRVAVMPSGNILTRRRYNHPQVRRIICVSDYIRKVMQDYLSEPEKAVTIHSGIDPGKVIRPSFDLRAELSVPENHRVVGIIAALSPEKDIDTFLNAAKICLSEASDLKFVIVGDGPLRGSLEKRTDQLGIRPHVSFTGHVHHPLEYLQQFDLFAFTSLQEGLGTSVLDAFACKTGVVASRTGGIPEMIDHGRTGRLVSPGDATGFAREIMHALNHPEETRRMVEAARHTLARFDYHTMARQTAECYKEIS